MIYSWYKIFNKIEFEALGLVSRTYTLNLEGIGQREILVTKGNFISALYDGVHLVLGLNDKNPFEFEGHAIFLDESNDVWIGVLIED